MYYLVSEYDGEVMLRFNHGALNINIKTIQRGNWNNILKNTEIELKECIKEYIKELYWNNSIKRIIIKELY